MSTPHPHPAALSAERLLAECSVSFARRSGPGGQNRNKVETAAILVHLPTGISAEANERRSQAQNRESALFRLRLKLALEVRSSGSLPASPSELWNSRLRGTRVEINPSHVDFPAMLAEALDVLFAFEDDLKQAATHLSCSPSQLARLIKDEPRAFSALNARRKERGLRPLQ